MLMQTQKNPELKHALEHLFKITKLRAIDVAFADFIYGEEVHLVQPIRDCLCLLAAHLSAQSGSQHSCVDINDFEQPFLGVYAFPEREVMFEYLLQSQTICCLDHVNGVAPQQTNRPIIIENGHLYLQRYWQYESQLAVMIRDKSAKSIQLDLSNTRGLLADLFSDGDNLSLDWQKIAVCIAASQSLSFITGGPGTGKTTTVTKLLALLQGLAAKKNQVLNIQLVAPTGKAAARLTESISAAKQRLPQSLQLNLPEQCQTIHRLLGSKPQSPYFKADLHHPLHLDVLVLDEGSMVDLPLMAKLFAALPKNAQIVMLGDQDQLASVETGSVLSDICAASFQGKKFNDSLEIYSVSMQEKLVSLMQVNDIKIAHSSSQQQSVIQDNVVKLIKSHRFKDSSGIGQLAKHINAGQTSQCMTLLKSEQYSDIHWYQPAQTTVQAVSNEMLKTLITQLLPIYLQYIQAVKEGNLLQAFAYLQQQQVLCAQKSGFWGVMQVNGLIEGELHKQGVIDNSKDFYVGRPVMLSKNDHPLKLFNGDIGIVMPDPNNPTLTKVWFVTPEGEFRGLLPSRLPSLETLYAMTIHKSQGSEFDAVYLCLPPITGNHQGRGLNRELIYTGLTRAKRLFYLYCESKALSLSLGQQCVRGSGLATRLLMK